MTKEFLLFCLLYFSLSFIPARRMAPQSIKRYFSLMTVFALNLHKCQGLILTTVHIDCKNISVP